MTDKIDREVLANRYGFSLAFFRAHPDLDKLFKQAVKNNFSGDEFVARLRGTKWFKTTADTARQWAVLNASDPATAKSRLNQRIHNVQQMVGKSGVTGYSAQEIEDLARRSLMMGWDDAQLTSVVGKSFEYNPDQSYKGTAGDVVGSVRKIANDYLVPVSDAVIQKWARQVIAGTASADDYAEYAKTQAKSLMPALSKQIDAGMTVQDLIDPYRQVASNLLGVSPDSIDFMQSKWRRMVDSIGQDGQRTMLSLTDAERLIKTDSTYGYDRSADGISKAADFNTKIAQMFGQVA